MAASVVFASGQTETREIHIYSHRHYETCRTLYDEFERETVIRVRVVQAGADELIRRLVAEGESSPADDEFSGRVADYSMPRDRSDRRSYVSSSIS
jgi:iron(III) transport system substrate-binding protein